MRVRFFAVVFVLPFNRSFVRSFDRFAVHMFGIWSSILFSVCSHVCLASLLVRWFDCFLPSVVGSLSCYFLDPLAGCIAVRTFSIGGQICLRGLVCCYIRCSFLFRCVCAIFCVCWVALVVSGICAFHLESCSALRANPGGNPVDGLPPALSIDSEGISMIY